MAKELLKCPRCGGPLTTVRSEKYEDGKIEIYKCEKCGGPHSAKIFDYME